MASKKNNLEKALGLIKELPAASKLSAFAALGSSSTLLAAGNAAAGVWKVYQEVSAHRWYWEDHVTTGLKKLAELGILPNPERFDTAFDMVQAGSLRYMKRSDWYSNWPLVEGSEKLVKPRRIPDAPPFIYVALGDSAAQGVGVEDVRQSYVALFASYLRRATRRRVIVLNLSISGALVTTIANTQIPKLLSYGITPDLITLDIGGNDTFFAKKITVEDFLKNFQIVVNRLPVQTLIAEVPSASPLPQDARSQELNRIIIETVAPSAHVMVPVRKLGEVPPWKALSIRAGDGFHPNAQSYRLTALEFARTAQPLLKSRGLWQDSADVLE